MSLLNWSRSLNCVKARMLVVPRFRSTKSTLSNSRPHLHLITTTANILYPINAQKHHYIQPPSSPPQRYQYPNPKNRSKSSTNQSPKPWQKNESKEWCDAFLPALHANKLAGDNIWHYYRNLDQETRSKFTINDYNALLKALRKDNMDKNTLTLQRIQLVHSHMMSVDISPNNVSFNELMCVHVALLNFSQARAIMEEMKLKKSRSIYPFTIQCYSDIVNLLNASMILDGCGQN